MAGQQICLKWNSFQSNIVTSFENLWEEEGLVDVTLASDGQCLRAHKVILSACSPFFRKVFQANPCQHPVIILQDVHFTELESLLYFVYKGEVNIEQENLPALLRAAETLQIRGLSGASEQVKEKMGVSKKSATTAATTNGTTAIPSPVPPVTQEATTAEGPTPSKRPRSIQQSQSPPLPSTPLALTPTSRPSHLLRNSSTTSAEPWEQPQQPGEPAEFPPKIVPKVEAKDAESDAPSSPLLSVEENFDDSTDGSLPDFAHSQGISTSVDTGQIKGISRSETTTLAADANSSPLQEASKLEASTGQGDSNYDPNQATKNFPYPPFPCPFCDRAYTSWGFRRRHIKAMHTQSQKLPCKWCLVTLPSHLDWERHVMAKHSLSINDARNGLLILEEAHMVLQIPNPTRLDTFVNMIKNKKNAESNGVAAATPPEAPAANKKANGSAGEGNKSGV